MFCVALELPTFVAGNDIFADIDTATSPDPVMETM
jgi:hypothetical protein